jgi:hypothetical protein
MYRNTEATEEQPLATANLIAVFRNNRAIRLAAATRFIFD